MRGIHEKKQKQNNIRTKKKEKSASEKDHPGWYIWVKMHQLYRTKIDFKRFPKGPATVLHYKQSELGDDCTDCEVKAAPAVPGGEIKAPPAGSVAALLLGEDVNLAPWSSVSHAD